MPGPRNLFEQLERGPLLLRPLPGLGGVLTLIEQPLGFGPLLAGDRQRDGRIFAEAQQFFLAVEAVFQAPELRSVRLDEQVQAFSIGQLVGALPLGGVFDLKFFQSHLGVSPVLGTAEKYPQNTPNPNRRGWPQPVAPGRRRTQRDAKNI